MQVVQSPDVEQAKELLQEYLSRPYLLHVTGLCSVEYQGRAKSKLDRGERLLIVKQDNALLIHGPENYQPKNWQPETDIFNVTVDDGKLVLESIRKNPEERVIVEFETLDLIVVDQLVDKAALQVRGHEVDIHEAIEQNPDIVEDGLTVVEREKKTPAGLIDVFARDTDNNLVVIEVKRNPNHNSVLQLDRYVKEIRDEFPGRTIRGILVAPDTSDSVIDYLEERDLSFVPVAMEDVIADYESFGSNQSALNQFGAEYSK